MQIGMRMKENRNQCSAKSTTKRKIKMKHNEVHTKGERYSILNRPAIVCLFTAVVAWTLLVSAIGQQTWPPAGVAPNSPWTPTKSIDFSSKHNVLIKSDDGTLTPMDVPYYKTTLIAPGTWQILSDGDYAYLIEGDNEALAIDSTYGAGNIRQYMQTLTKKPLRYVANTHEHFDHTANNSYFDRAYMSAETQKHATIPYPSFTGITFPRDYPVQVIGDGYVFHLGNCDIEVFEIPNHTMGDLAFLDKRERLLFSGDVFLGNITINANSSVARFAANMRKLEARRKDFDRLAGGPGVSDASYVDKLLANAEYILAGHEGAPATQPNGPRPAQGQGAGQGQAPWQNTPSPGPNGEVVYNRKSVRPPDRAQPSNVSPENMRRMTYNDSTITYDIRHIKN